MAVTKYILKNTYRQTSVKFVGTGQSTFSIYEALKSDQTIDAANVKLDITDIYHETSATANIVRGSNVIISMVQGQDMINFAQVFGFSLSENSNSNITVNLGTGENTMILQLSKTSGYNETDRQTLQPKDR